MNWVLLEGPGERNNILVTQEYTLVSQEYIHLSRYGLILKGSAYLIYLPIGTIQNLSTLQKNKTNMLSANMYIFKKFIMDFIMEHYETKVPHDP